MSASADAAARSAVTRLVDLTADRGDDQPTLYVHARSFVVGWTAGGAGAPLEVDVDTEYLVLLPDCGAELLFPGGSVRAPARSVCILPPGRTAVLLDRTERCIRLFSAGTGGLAAVAGPAQAAAAGLPVLAQVHPAFERIGNGDRPVVHAIDDLPNSPGMPRAKLFQSATLSINWVEYDGPRNRQALSPHAHTDIEQGSLAIEGAFVHHIRTPWGPDADNWQDDAHLSCAKASLAIIPPPIIHTTEGVGRTPHLLIDIFSPPRRDFIARGAVLNANAYRDTTA